jgi:hypothetical protein
VAGGEGGEGGWGGGGGGSGGGKQGNVEGLIWQMKATWRLHRAGSQPYLESCVASSPARYCRGSCSWVLLSGLPRYLQAWCARFVKRLAAAFPVVVLRDQRWAQAVHLRRHAAHMS